jgi:hypothetical protein
MGDHAAAVENYRALIGYARRIDDIALEADGLNHLVTAQVVLAGPSAETDAQLERALTLAQTLSNPELTARALWNRGLAYRLTDPQRAADDFARALEMADATNLRQVAAFVRMDLSLALVHLERAQLAQQYLEEALDAFRSLDLKPMMADALGSMAYHAYTRGEPNRARAFAEEGLAISKSIENPWGVLYNEMFCVLILELERGHLTRVLQESEPYLIRANQLGYPYFVVMHHAILTWALLELEQVADAHAWAIAATQEFGIEKDNPLALWARWLQAMVAIRRGESSRARELLAPLMEIKGFPLGPLDFSGWLGQTLAELALLERKLDAGVVLCDQHIRGFEEQEQFGFAAPMYYWRARLHFAEGDMGQAKADALRAGILLEQAENWILLWRAKSLLAEISAARDTN